MSALKHLLIVLGTYATAVPFLWPLRSVDDPPIDPAIWLLVILSTIANVVVIVYHYTVPPHPKFLMIWWRRAVLRIHIISGTTELGLGLWCLINPNQPFAGTLMAITALFFHVPSAFGQTPIVFGSRAIMRPAYLACIGVHAFCAFMLLTKPGSTYWAASTFLVFNVYVWCRIYYFLFDKFSLFDGARYSVSILAAGLTTMPAVVGSASMVLLVFCCATYIALYRLLLIREPLGFRDFVRERARDSAYAPGVSALFGSVPQKEDLQSARRLFDRLTTSGKINKNIASKLLGDADIPVSAAKSFIDSKMGTDGGFDFEEFCTHIWSMREVRALAIDVSGIADAKSERDKAEFIFKRLDLDHDDALHRFELEALLDEWAMPKKETQRWLDKLGSTDGKITFELFFTKMRPIWRFVYYDISEAKHGKQEDMIARAWTAQSDALRARRLRREITHELISKIDFLHDADDAFVEELASSMVEERHVAGTQLFCQGDAGDSFFILRSGNIEVSRDAEKLAVLSAGDWMGEGALLSDNPRSATATVVSDSIIYRMTRASFGYLLERHPAMRDKLNGIHEERHLSEMLSVIQKQLLTKVPFLANASSALISDLAAALRRENHEGEVFAQGSTGEIFYIVGGGLIHILRGGELVAELGHGGYFGEGALLSGAPRAATAVAVEPSVLYTLTRAAFERILDTHAVLAKEVRSVDAQRSQDLVRGILEHQLLSRLSFLRDADDEFLQTLSTCLRPVQFKGGETIFHEGEEGSTLYFVTQGLIRIESRGMALAELSQGAYFGEMALLSEQPRSATAIVVADAQLLSLHREDLYELIAQYPAMGRTIDAMRRERTKG